MDIEWWEVLISLGVAAALAWSQRQELVELRLNKLPAPKQPSHAASESSAGDPARLAEAHKHCFKNRDEIKNSVLCGCFYCEKTFSSSEVEEWTDDDQTAMCPFCGIDSVIGSGVGFEITPGFLRSMNERYF
jgi:hypothetical protein